MSVTAQELAKLPVFRDASPDALSALARRALEMTFPAGAVVFLAGSAPRGWYVVLEGCIRVVRGNGSRQYVLHTERAGGTLAEVPMFGGSVHPATGIAVEPTRCAVFDRASLEAALNECPSISFLINRRLALRIKRLVERLDERSRSVKSRLAEFLLDRASRSATRGRLSLGMTQQALAEELGTVREVISREIKALARDGVIRSLGGGRYEVRDASELRRRLGPPRC